MQDRELRRHVLDELEFELARRVVDVLGWDSLVPAGAVHVKVQAGWFTLTGAMDWDHQRRGCESTVRRLSGVCGLNHQITVKERLQSGDLRASVDRTLARIRDQSIDRQLGDTRPAHPVHQRSRP